MNDIPELPNMKLTTEQMLRLIEAIVDPTGIRNLKPDDPLPLKAVLHNAGYFAGATKAEQVVTEMMQVAPNTSEADRITIQSLAASFVLRHLDEGTLDTVGHGALVAAGEPADDATQEAVLAAGAPEWNEHYGDDYRSGFMSGFLDFLEENLMRYVENNT